MLLSADMRELIALFRRHRVRYLVVGGHAVNYYGYVRATQDMDLLVFPSPENAQRIMNALSEFGFAGAGIPSQLFEQEGGAVHLGTEPNRIDILTSLKGISNNEIFAGAQTVEIDGETVNIISFDHLLEVKKSSDRPRDLADADELLNINTGKLDDRDHET
jgi:predicted nucleotidyltransferase